MVSEEDFTPIKELIEAGLVEKVDDKQWKNTIYFIKQKED